MLYVSERFLLFGRDAYLAVLLAFYTAQLSFVPLLLGPVLAQSRGWCIPPLGTRWAVAVLLTGAVTGMGLTLAGILRNDGDLMWSSVIVCLGSSTLVYLGRIAFQWLRGTSVQQ